MECRELLTPQSIVELAECLRRGMQKTRLICGGTDLTIELKEHRAHAQCLIDLSGVQEMRGVQAASEEIVIGAACTYTELTENPLIQRYLPALLHAAAGVGSRQIRNRGSLGGNLANASPAGDSIPVLMALGASAVLLGAGGASRRLTIPELVLGSGKTALRPDEAIVQISIPIPIPGARSAFVKLGSRARVSIAKIGLALSTVEQAGVMKAASIALSAVGQCAFLSARAGEALLGRADSPGLRADIAELLCAEIEDSIPGRASLPYKREAVKGLTEDLFTCLSQQAPLK